MEDPASRALAPTATVVASFLASHKISAAEIPSLIAAVHGALGGLSKSEAATPAKAALTPKQIRKSIMPDALISFEDGKSYRTLKRHLTTRGMTSAQYREKWGLPSDYPTTAPSYSALRAAMAKSFGLGARGRKQTRPAAATVAEPQTPPATRPARRGRPKKVTP